MATIKDVALRAGVSVTTVSHVVNDTRHVSAKGRERVELAIRELGYVPNAMARSLKSNTTSTLGMLIPNSSNPYFAEIVRIVEDRCFGAGYTLVLCNTDDEPRRQSVYLQVLAERRIDGLIVVSTGDDDSLVTQLQGLRIPTVLVDREIADPSCDLVETAHMQGGLLAVRHLLSLGHKRIACLGGPEGLTPSEQRIEGWRMALAEAGTTPNADALLWRGAFTSQSGYEAMHAILRTEHPPSAVFVCNDLMAIGALRAAHESGVHVPDELSIVGFDDIELSAYTSPPLTTVAQPKERIGALAVDMLLERVSGKRRDARKVVLQPELRVRASTARHASFKEPAAPATESPSTENRKSRTP
ncbi:LacI family transcriptional regulator [Variovorax boronicumulans]|uniref:Transcriptional regulator, LacI family n=1 Tax=Variovorax paradoxus (strain EPS) TaxID=595537 RepID=E6V691_VARPE|nr:MULTISPECIES: LacI family DNA-binding transcriptional regulator [Variovorax]ADU39400.1 transcriptional regulator, LacI family [Variovorax paradoxus EPS]MDQ0037659.1 LacI family transcriptional regulator [Variovorax boronicumulans]MDQ0043540.1 LacI family transcriptional regulator [Variovorax boronicumulans]MDQ0073057.1 LacI family transcriptional regulator [Variovorax boronicumulans]MDQ0606034.1 LacI family transcriptional regulator [Variovorax sp. W1I1]